MTDANDEVGIIAEIPYQIELPQDFVDEHVTALQTGQATVCVPGGRAIRFPNSALPDQVIIPEGADLQLFLSGQLPGEGEPLGLGTRTLLVVRVSGTSQSPVESIEELAGAVFGLGSQPLINSMRAQFERCSFSQLDLTPASGFPELYNGVVDLQLPYNLQGRSVFRVMSDAVESVAETLGIDSLGKSFDHVMFCIAKGTTYGRANSEWSAFAPVKGWRSALNSNRCNSLSFMMHEIGHNLGLVHSSGDIFNDEYGDTSGMVSCRVDVFIMWNHYVSTGNNFPSLGIDGI